MPRQPGRSESLLASRNIPPLSKDERGALFSTRGLDGEIPERTTCFVLSSLELVSSRGSCTIVFPWTAIGCSMAWPVQTLQVS